MHREFMKKMKEVRSGLALNSMALKNLSLNGEPTVGTKTPILELSESNSPVQVVTPGL
jgi:hypothetical protein